MRVAAGPEPVGRAYAIPQTHYIAAMGPASKGKNGKGGRVKGVLVRGGATSKREGREERGTG